MITSKSAPERGEGEDRPVERVDLHREASAIGVIGGVDRRPLTDDFADPLDRGVGDDFHVMDVAYRLDPAADVRGQVVGRQGPRIEGVARRLGLAEPIDTERAPVLAIEVVGDEVPAARQRHQPVRLDVPMRCGGVGGGVVEPQPDAVAARLGDAPEHIG